MHPTDPDSCGYILEFHRIGTQVKVTAIDPESMREASIFGPAQTRPEDLKALAVRKLRYMLERDKT